MRTTCLYCGGPLIKYHHWGLCPVCEPDYVESVKPPSIAEQIAAKVGGLLREKGRPTVNGVSK